jgi:hypothetical protein
VLNLRFPAAPRGRSPLAAEARRAVSVAEPSLEQASPRRYRSETRTYVSLGIGLTVRVRFTSFRMVLCRLEHPHRCVYCHRLWFCPEACPIAGPSACDDCREKARTAAGTTRRVIALDNVWVLDCLTEHTAEQLRAALRRSQQ